MPSLLNSNAGPSSNLDLQTAAARVARVIGNESDAQALNAAKDAIAEAIDEWNSRHDWKFLQVVAPNISISSSATSWALPTTFKKPYDAYLLTARVKLGYATRQVWDSLAPGNVTTGVPCAYSLYNTGTSGAIELLPPPSAADTLVVRYYRPISTPTNPDDPLDVPKRYEGALIAMARGILAGLKDADAKAQLWLARGEQGFRNCKADDVRIPDESLSFDPEPYRSALFNLNWTGEWMLGE